MRTDADDLESRIRIAFQYRADTLPEPSAFAPPPPQRVDKPAREGTSRVFVIAGAVTVAVFVAFAWWALRSPSNDDQARISTGSEATSLPTVAPTILPAPVTGAEVPLTEAATSETDRLSTLMQRDSPGTTDVVVVQIPDRAPVIAYHDPTGSQCMTVVPTPAPQAGYQGACMPNPNDIVGTLDPPTDSPTSTAYGVWTDVPPGTAYVTFTYGTQHAWQRPIKGVSYFTIRGYRPPLGPEPLTMRAYDAQGTELGHATRSPYQDGSGHWAW